MISLEGGGQELDFEENRTSEAKSTDEEYTIVRVSPARKSLLVVGRKFCQVW